MNQMDSSLPQTPGAQSPMRTRPTATRRSVLRAAGGAAAVGLTVGTAGATAGTDARLVFTFDDGYVEDYTQTFPIFQNESVPASIAVPSANVNRGERFLTAEQITEMTKAGWEVLSHGIHHEALGSVRVTRDVSPGDTRVYVESTVLGRTPNEVEILGSGDTRATAMLAGMGEDNTGRYLTLKSAVDASFTGGQATMRFTEDVVRRVLQDSKKSLRDRGFGTTNLVLPYDRYNSRTIKLIREYYDAVENTGGNGINGGSAANPYGLSRAYFRDGFMTKADLGDYLDRVAEINALGILAGHSRHQQLTGKRIQNAIQMAKERDIEIVTLQTALQDFGIVETPTSTATPSTPTTTPGTSPTSGSTTGDGGFFQWLRNLLASLF